MHDTRPSRHLDITNYLPLSITVTLSCSACRCVSCKAGGFYYICEHTHINTTNYSSNLCRTCDFASIALFLTFIHLLLISFRIIDRSFRKLIGRSLSYLENPWFFPNFVKKTWLFFCFPVFPNLYTANGPSISVQNNYRVTCMTNKTSLSM